MEEEVVVALKLAKMNIPHLKLLKMRTLTPLHGIKTKGSLTMKVETRAI